MSNDVAVKARKKHKKISSDKVFQIIVVTFVCVHLLLVLYPLLYVVACSFSNGTAVTSGMVYLWPVGIDGKIGIDLTGYELVFQHKMVWTGYLNTILYTVTGATLGVIFTIIAAYPLSRRNFQGKKFVTTIFGITMFFGGGLIPHYILLQQIGFVDTRINIILSGVYSMSHIILMRTAFQQVPNDLLESAKLDGISDFGYLLKIVLPLSKATISVIALYCVVGHWNSYTTPLIYLRTRSKFPLQLILQEILSSTKIDVSELGDSQLAAKLEGATDVMKYSLIMVSTLPMLVLYPCVQKFFEKGVMMGSLKG